MTKRTSKKSVTPAKKPAAKRRVSTTHAFLIGVGVLSSGIVLAASSQISVPVPASLKPDFTVTSAGYLSSGEFGYTIKNNGAATTTELARVFEWQDAAGHVLAAYGVLSSIGLAKGESVVATGVNEDMRTFLRMWPEGTKKMHIVLDGNNLIKETNESNNQITVPIGIDLAVTNAGFSSSGALSFNVTNAGPAAAPDVRVTLRWLTASGTEIGTPFTVTSTKVLAPASGIASSQIDQLGKIAEFLKAWDPAARKVKVQVATVKNAQESNTGNNETIVTLPKPNLSMGLSSYAPGSPLKFTITNTNVWGAARPTIKLEWRDERGVSFQTCAAPFQCPAFAPGATLPVGGHQDFQMSAAAPFLAQRPSKAARLDISVLPDATQGDSNMVNNANVLGWPLADFQLVSASFDANKNFLFTVKNAGQVPTGPMTVKLEWIGTSGNALDNGASFSFSQPIAVGASLQNPGMLASSVIYYVGNRPANATKLRVTIDPTDQVAESNPNNNTTTVVYPQ